MIAFVQLSRKDNDSDENGALFLIPVF